MSGPGVAQIVVFTVVLLAVAYPVGLWMAHVYSAARLPLAGAERAWCRVLGIDAKREQDWKQYAKSVLALSLAFVAFLYALLRLQGHLPLNPDGMKAVSPQLALNTAASFLTNTNWQFYAGESTMSYLSQMAGLAVQNFVSAAVAMAVLVAVIRGFVRRTAHELGNFWIDLYRSLVYILLPLAVVATVILIAAGVPQTFAGHATAHTLQGHVQQIARGPVASQIAIKHVGTNGGGFYNANSAAPFESPSNWTGMLELFLELLIPAASVFMFGRMVGSMRQAGAILAAMVALFAVGVGVAYPAEQHGSQVLRASGVNLAQGRGSPVGTWRARRCGTASPRARSSPSGRPTRPPER